MSLPDWINEGPDLTPEPLPGIRAEWTSSREALNRCMAWLFSVRSSYPGTVEGALAIARYPAMSALEQDAMNFLIHSSGSGSREHCTVWLRDNRQRGDEQ